MEVVIEFPRNDLRGPHEIRPIGVEYSISQESEGSVKVTLGKTCLIAMISGPSQPRFNRHEEFDKATLDIDFRSSSKSNIESRIQYERKMNELLSNIFLAAIDRKQYPRKLIVMKLSLIRDDGNILSASIIACTLALLESGIMMFYLPIPVTCVVHQLNNQILVDPNIEEENASQSLHTFIFNVPESIVCDKDVNGEMGRGDKDEDEDEKEINGSKRRVIITPTDSLLLTTHSLGTFSSNTLLTTLTLCQEISFALKNVLRNLMKESSHQHPPTLALEEE